MDSDWVFNFDNTNPPTNTPKFFDTIIIPSIFYNAVIARNVNAVNNIIKHNPVLSIKISNFYINTLENSFYTKKDARYGAPVRISWKVESKKPIILNFNDQVNLYQYIAQSQWSFTNFGFLVNTINNYLVNLRTAMKLINNNYPANNFYKYGINITNNAQMKTFISYFIPGFIRN